MKNLAVCILFIYSLVHLQAYSKDSVPEPPYGLWSWCKEDEQQVIDLHVVLKKEMWSVTVNGNTYQARNEGGNIAFAFPDKQRFSIIKTDGPGLEGIWTQPAMSHYGYYAQMQTRTALFPTTDNEWQGSISVQPRPYHLFLDVFDHEPQQLKAVVRNPEGNDVFGKTIFDVNYVGASQSHQDWTLSAKRRNRHIEIPVKVTKDNTIRISHPRVPETVTLSKNNNCDPAWYYSRTSGSDAVKRQSVVKRNDGWQIADAEVSGFNGIILDELIERLANADPRSASPELLHSLLVSHKGKLVLEEYFFGHNYSTVHDTRSLAKVFGSLLIGIAQQQKLDLTPDYNPLRSIYAELKLPIPANKDAIKLEHFLTYSSGLDSAEDDISPGSESMLWQQYQKPFWHYTATLPVLHPPGKRYAYSSASANMVGAAIQQVSNKSPHLFFHESIAKPLSFADYHWNLGNDDVPYLGGGVYLRPRDILKIGALYAAKGKWNGKQIIPETWIAQSTSAKLAITPQTTGLSEEAFYNSYVGGHQAFVWLVKPILVGDQEFESYQATGNGGQVVVVVPALELAVGFTGGNYRMGRIWSQWSQNIIGGYLIPALLEKQN